MNSGPAEDKLTRYLAYLVGFILVLIPFHAFLTVWLASAFGHYTALRLWKEFLLIFLVAGAAYTLVKDKALCRNIYGQGITKLILLYIALTLVWGAGGYIFHQVTLKALGYGLIVNLRYFIFFLVVMIAAAKSQRLANNWSKILLWPAAVVVIFGLLEELVLPYNFLAHFGYSSATIFPYETINHNTHYIRIMSTLRGANPLGAYLLVILSAAAVGIKNRGKTVWAWWLLGAGALVDLVFSYSREAWLGLVVSGIVFIWASLKSKAAKKIIAAGLGALVIIAAAALLALHSNPTFQNLVFHTQANSAVKLSSNAQHESAFKAGLSDSLRHPLGRGVGTAGPASVYNNNPRISENYLIQIAQETGWFGAILITAIFYLVAKRLWANRSDNLSKALVVSLAGLVVVSMLSHAWTDDTLAYLWWGLAGVALGTGILTDRKAANGRV